MEYSQGIVKRKVVNLLVNVFQGLTTYGCNDSSFEVKGDEFHISMGKEEYMNEFVEKYKKYLKTIALHLNKLELRKDNDVYKHIITKEGFDLMYLLFSKKNPTLPLKNYKYPEKINKLEISRYLLEYLKHYLQYRELSLPVKMEEDDLILFDSDEDVIFAYKGKKSYLLTR